MLGRLLWRFSRRRIVSEELRGTCRGCGKPISLRRQRREDETVDKWRRWEAWRVAFTSYEAEDDSTGCEPPQGNHQPMEWCQWAKGSGETCHKRIKAEDISGRFYACGVHMKNEIAEHKRIQERKEQQEAKEEAKELAKWEGEVYTMAYDIIRQALPDMEFRLASDAWRSDSDGIRSNVAHVERYSDGHTTVRKYIKVDMLALQDALLALLERQRDEFQTEQADPG